MPKKFSGENSKAAAARARKNAAKDAASAKKQKEAEDAYWEDTDKNAQKRQAKKELQEQKRQAQLDKKAEAQAQLEKEVESVSKPTKQPLSKLTRAQISAEAEKRNAAAAANTAKLAEKKIVEQELVFENFNHFSLDASFAQNIDEALALLQSEREAQADRHPERRMKAAYAAYEDRLLPYLRERNPVLRMSQLKEIIYKEWQRSPENPMNQPRDQK